MYKPRKWYTYYVLRLIFVWEFNDNFCVCVWKCLGSITDVVQWALGRNNVRVVNTPKSRKKLLLSLLHPRLAKPFLHVSKTYMHAWIPKNKLFHCKVQGLSGNCNANFSSISLSLLRFIWMLKTDQMTWHDVFKCMQRIKHFLKYECHIQRAYPDYHCMLHLSPINYKFHYLCSQLLCKQSFTIYQPLKST